MIEDLFLTVALAVLMIGLPVALIVSNYRTKKSLRIFQKKMEDKIKTCAACQYNSPIDCYCDELQKDEMEVENNRKA